MRAALVFASANRKTGPIPTSMTEPDSCPSSCPLRGQGCYAELGLTRRPWLAVGKGERGAFWQGFLAQVARIAAGSLWRHNVAGDLPHVDDKIDAPAMAGLLRVQTGKRGFTYTHHDVFDGEHATHNAAVVREANAAGFTVNVSCEQPEKADRAMSEGHPAVLVVPSDAPRRTTTPQGRPVLTCPATYNEATTCATCGWCALSRRQWVVAFPAHGTRWRMVDGVLHQLQGERHA